MAVQDLRGGEGDVEEVGRVVLQGEGGCVNIVYLLYTLLLKAHLEPLLQTDISLSDKYYLDDKGEPRANY